MLHPIADTSPPLRRFTRKELARLVALGFFREDERVELIHGILVRMTPPGPPHRSVVDLLNEILVPRLLGRARVSIQQPFAASDDSEPEPDVAVAPIGDYFVDHPKSAFLVVEVADSSLAYDRKTKGPLYAASGVPEYWIVNVPERTVEVHTAPDAGAYSRVEVVKSGVVRLSAFPSRTILGPTGTSIAGSGTCKEGRLTGAGISITFPDVEVKVGELFPPQ